MFEETTVESLNIGKPQGYKPVFSVFPNPADDILNIAINTSVPGSVLAEIFDLQGKKLMSREFICNSSFQGSINTSSLSSGSYFVRARNGNTDYSATVNIVR